MRLFLAIILAMTTQLALANTKVGVVDMERALFLSDAAQTSLKKFEKDNQSEVNKLKELQQELLALKDKNEKDADVMSDEERRKLVGQFEEKSATYKFYAQKLQQAEIKWRQDFFQEQQPRIEKVLKEIIDKEKYDIILQAGAVVYTAPTSDLTKKLIDRLNAKK